MTVIDFICNIVVGFICAVWMLIVVYGVRIAVLMMAIFFKASWLESNFTYVWHQSSFQEHVFYC